jgi:hypothetical protein
MIRWTRARWVRWLGCAWLAALLAAVLAGGVADARPGGGHSSSSSSHSSSSSSHSSSHSYSGGGGSGGDSFGVILGVCLVFAVIVMLNAASKRRQEPAWTSAQRTVSRAVDLSPVTDADPDFSRAVFEDFAFQLYAAAHRHRSEYAALGVLAPYLSAMAAGHLVSRGPAPEQIVIGTLRIDAAGLVEHPARQQITVQFEATLLRGRRAVLAVEYWMFGRDAGVRSRPPTRTRTWPCPSCGAPWSGGNTRLCDHCGERIDAGRFDWAVDHIRLGSERATAGSLTGTVAEAGNDLPTVVDPHAREALASLEADDPDMTLPAVRARAELIYRRLNEAWNARDLTPVRGLVTQSLRGYLGYWLAEYERQQLRNELGDARILDLQLAKLTRDKYFDAITLRVFADGHECTLDASGKIVGGSRTIRRCYTEYWTFLRSASRRGPTTITPGCPNCGAPLDISDAGDCTHCNAAVESGDFDWVLSKIEQDDVYAG